MKTLKKVKLKTKNPSKNLDKPVIYSSGFCITDNKNFALFNVPINFLVDKGITDVLSFKLSEDDLWMLIDRSKSIRPSKGTAKVAFGVFGLVDREHFDMLTSINPNCQFYPVTEWFGTASNRLLVGLPDKEGKPIGVLKTIVE
jgi:hypothetical protein